MAVRLTLVAVCAALLAPVWAQATKDYTIVRSVKTYSLINNSARETRQVEAWRDDGASVLQIYDDQGYWSTISLPREKVVVQYDPKYRNKVTWPLHQDMIERHVKRFDPADRCMQAVGAGAKFLGASTVADTPVLIYGGQFNPQVNRYIDVQSLAPSLNCARLRRELTQVDGQGRQTGSVIEDTVSVRKGPPAASMFEIPADAKEVLPSKMRTDRYMGTSSQDMRQQILVDTATMDKRYLEEHGKKK